MSIRKPFNLLVAVLVIGMILVGFAGIAADKVITLKVLYYRDATNPGIAREDAELWNAFAKKYPNIKIEREDLFNEPYHQKVAALSAADDLPDVIYVWPSGRSSVLYDKKQLKDLRPLLNASGEAKNFMPAAIGWTTNGILGEIPMTVTCTNANYVNVKMLKDNGLEVPRTYGDLVDIAGTLRAKGKDTALMGYQDSWVGQSCLFSMIVGRMCGDKFIDDCVAGKAKFTDKRFVNALKFYANMYSDGVLSKKNLQISYNDVNGLFASGKGAFLIDGDWKVGNFLTDPTTKQALIPPAQQKNFAIMNFPIIPGEIEHDTNSIIAGVGLGMNAKIPAGSEKEAAAWKLIMWFNSPEVQKMRLETGGGTPSRKGVNSDQLEPLMQEVVRFKSDLGKATYVLDGVLHTKVYTPINDGLQEIGLGLATPVEVAQEVQKALEAWLKEK